MDIPSFYGTTVPVRCINRLSHSSVVPYHTPIITWQGSNKIVLAATSNPRSSKFNKRLRRSHWSLFRLHIPPHLIVYLSFLTNPSTGFHHLIRIIFILAYYYFNYGFPLLSVFSCPQQSAPYASFANSLIRLDSLPNGFVEHPTTASPALAEELPVEGRRGSFDNGL